MLGIVKQIQEDKIALAQEAIKITLRASNKLKAIVFPRFFSSTICFNGFLKFPEKLL
jgi:hypothetical protein